MATAELTAAARAPAPLRPILSKDQKQLVLAAAGELIAAAVVGRPVTLADPTLAGAVDQILSGAFVSLKRGKHLRSCCGMLGQPITLGLALQDAAVRTAREDMRFPPVSPSELEYLEMEVWLLYAPEPMPVRGEARVGAVTVGKHGLQVVRGQSRGLLLPGVPVENHWDAERFLEQVCVKAGLPPTSWKDDATALFTFEGDAIRGAVAAAQVPGPAAPLFRPEELAAYAEFCRSNIAALLSGTTPSYYFFGAPDGNVSGVALTARRDGGAENMNFMQLSMRPGVPLQATLYALAQSAAQALARQGVRVADLPATQLTLTILHDAALHGTVAEPDLRGIDPKQRAALVVERNKTGLVFDPQLQPPKLVEGAASEAAVSNPAAAAVFSLQALTTAEIVSVSTAPKPVRGPAVRPAGVAGMFYPADAAELSRMIDGLLEGNGKPGSWSAAMVPHAGLIYSGRIAAAVLKRIKIPKTIIVIGPKHTALGVDWAVAPHETWELPGISVESDPVLARKLTQAIPGLELDAMAHSREHGIEVELPLIARLAPKTKVVGIAIGTGDLEGCRRFAAGLAELFSERKERPLFLVSSDMNHFATDAENRRLDEIALSALERLDPADLHETVTKNRISMCGVLPAVIVLETLRLLGGLKKVERVGYATTADVTGDKSRVVGYAGMLFR